MSFLEHLDDLRISMIRVVTVFAIGMVTALIFYRETPALLNMPLEWAKHPETSPLAFALSQPGVRDVGRVLSMYVGPADALVTLDLDFDEGTTAVDATVAVAEVGRRVRERFPVIQRLFIESGSPALPQRWVRPDAVRTPSEGTAAY